jgi:hypothetical protein
MPTSCRTGYRELSTRGTACGRPDRRLPAGIRQAFTDMSVPDAPMLRVRTRCFGFHLERVAGQCHEQWRNHRILPGIMARIVTIYGTVLRSVLCTTRHGQLLRHPTVIINQAMCFKFDSVRSPFGTVRLPVSYVYCGERRCCCVSEESNRPLKVGVASFASRWTP